MARDMIVRWLIEYVPTEEEPRRTRVCEIYKSGMMKMKCFRFRSHALAFVEKRQEGRRSPWDRSQIHVPGTNSEVTQ